MIAVDVRAEALDFAREHGAHETLDSAEVEDAPAVVKDLTGGGAHLAIDCIALQSTLMQSLLSLRRAGRHVQVALTTKEYFGALSVPVDLINLFELQFLGCATSHSR